MRLSTTKQRIITGILMCVVVFTGAVIPTPFGEVDRAEAVVITADVSVASGIRNALAVTRTGLASQEAFKQNILDPLFWNLANAVISGMLTSLTQWVNSGFQGSPAFVTDLQGFLRDAADEAAGQFLADSGLDFLCSPFKLDVKIALNIQYQQARSATGGKTTQCTLSDITGNIENFLNGSFSDGGWAGWFELTQGPTNDPNKAFLEARARMSIAIKDAQGRNLVEVSANDFFLNVKVCENGISAGGSVKNCTTSTLGTIVEHQLNSRFDSTQNRLIVADEFDELVGALMAQFANQVIMGANGLLGMGGSSYSNNSFGSSGGSSYLDAVRQETAEQQGGQSSTIIADALAKEIEYQALQEEIIAMVDEVEADVDQARATFPSCFRVRMTPDLTDARDIALDLIIVSDVNIAILTYLKDTYDQATSPADKIAVMSEFSKQQSERFTATDLGIVQSELDIQYVLPDLIDTLQANIDAEVNRCSRNN